MKKGLMISGLILSSFGANAQPIITQQPTISQIVTNGGTVVFGVSVSGPGPFTYQWQFNGTTLPPIITTVAGNGINSFSGDNGAATSASLNAPTGVAVDTSGNLFIADLFNNRIRKVDTNGIISTIAGNGLGAFSGDGGVATNGELQSPYSVALDVFGNIFIADFNNNRIRKVDTNAIITTVAGNGSRGYSGDGGTAPNAALNNPTCVVADASGNLFIADYWNHSIRKVNTNGTITTVAGIDYGSYYGDGKAATNAALKWPSGLAVDVFGNLFIADHGNNRIRKVNTNGIITTVAGNGTIYSYPGDGGAATNASLTGPFGIALNARSDFFIADNFDYVIRKVDANGIITTIAGNGSSSFSGDGGSATSAGLGQPYSVAVDAGGNLFIADSLNNRIRKVQINSPTLVLNNVSTNSAGNYSVVITGSGGSVTSSVVPLTVAISPSIASQPQPLTVISGHAANFVVAADGLPTMAYQWQFNGTNLFAATNTMLTLPNAFPAAAGDYTVTISNAFGSITSNPAMLKVLPLDITAPTLLGSGQFQFSFDTATGVNYAVQYSTNLTQWFPFVILGGIGEPLTLIDPNTAISQQRFYRIILSPQ
ncbi:MAG: immunoglobulin domain-containing protein [Verrucomicrobiota bacterium]